MNDAWLRLQGLMRVPIPMIPEIVTLCGSTRFTEAFHKANYDLTLAGAIVLSVGCDTHSDEGHGLTEADKAGLDKLHFRKIDISDRIYVLNVDGYIGFSTKNEIQYAIDNGVRVDYLETYEQGPG